MNSSVIKRLGESVVLTEDQRSVIVGTLLGDGHLDTQNLGRTYRLKIEHSLNQREYVEWLYETFQTFTISPPRQKEQKVNETMYHKYGFSTIGISALRFYGQQFYVARKKVVPKLIGKMLTPLALAVWFMDDGSLTSRFHKARIINTQGFSRNDLDLLQAALADKLGILTTRRSQREGMQLYVPSVSVDLFIETIKPFMLPSMEYKIKLTQLHKE
jgi:recombination protein RecA